MQTERRWNSACGQPVLRGVRAVAIHEQTVAVFAGRRRPELLLIVWDIARFCRVAIHAGYGPAGAAQ